MPETHPCSLTEELVFRYRAQGIRSRREMARMIGIDNERLRGILNDYAVPQPPLWRSLAIFLGTGEHEESFLAMLGMQLRRQWEAGHP